MSKKQTLLLETFLSMGLNCCSYDKSNNKHHLFPHTSQALCSVSTMNKLPFHLSDTLMVR